MQFARQALSLLQRGQFARFPIEARILDRNRGLIGNRRQQPHVILYVTLGHGMRQTQPADQPIVDDERCPEPRADRGGRLAQTSGYGALKELRLGRFVGDIGHIDGRGARF